jgi:hypothetical protein
MTPELLIFCLRLLGATFLLAFLGLISWLIYQDMRVTAAILSDRQRHHGYLNLINSGTSSQLLGTRYPLLAVTSVGRATSNTVVLDDDFASSQHALVTLRGRQWWLEDLGSRNGTLLNGSPLEGAAVISAGDIITIGDARLKVELGENGVSDNH